jgi:hypothetical protein
MAMAKTLTKAGRKPGDEIEDRGCRYAPTCASCWLRECVDVMPPTDRNILALAWRTLQTFQAAPTPGDLGVESPHRRRGTHDG